MGIGGSRIELTADVESPIEPGLKVVMSSSLEEFGITEDKFWEILAKVKREPLLLPPDSGLTVAKHEMTDLEEGSFRVVDTLSGFPWGDSQVTMTHTYDKEKRTWVTESDRDSLFNKVPIKVITRVVQDPLRIENWCTSGAARISGPGLAGICVQVVQAILQEAGIEATVESKADADSPSGDGQKSVIIGPLEGIISIEKFWEVFDTLHRKGFPKPYLTSYEVKDLEGGGFHAIENFGNGVKINHVFHIPSADGSEWVTTQYVDLPESGPRDSDRDHCIHTKVHKDPFRVEVWSDVFPRTFADEGFKMMMQGMVDAVLEAAKAEQNAGSSWFG